MSCEARGEYIAVQKRRYRRAGKVYKTRLIDEVCEVCGYERKYVIKLLTVPGGYYKVKVQLQ